MPMSNEQLKKAEDWLAQHMPSRSCPACQKGEHSLAQDMISGQILYAGGENAPSFVPYFAAECGHCGHTMHFNARKAGLVR